MVWLAPARMSVLPPGGDFATDPVPIVPPAPARFSTITLRPSAWPSSLAIERAMVSCTAPAPKGTTMRTTGCAVAASAKSETAKAAKRRAVFICILLKTEAALRVVDEYFAAQLRVWRPLAEQSEELIGMHTVGKREMRVI